MRLPRQKQLRTLAEGRTDRHPGRWKITLEFKLEDLWVGAFWKSLWSMGYEIVYPECTKRFPSSHPDRDYYAERTAFDLWVCLVPCFPIHLTWYVVTPRQRDEEETEAAVELMARFNGVSKDEANERLRPALRGRTDDAR